MEGKATEEEKRHMIDFLSTIINKRNVVPSIDTHAKT
jgi:hypothetical protein